MQETLLRLNPLSGPDLSRKDRLGASTKQKVSTDFIETSAYLKSRRISLFSSTYMD
jgi:hypothetical protein